MAVYKNVNKVAPVTVSVNGFDCKSIVHNIKVYETICKPYITAELTFNNNKGQLNYTQLQSGISPVGFQILTGSGDTYSFSGIYTKAPDEFAAQNVGEGLVTIHAITTEYWNDKKNLVQKAAGRMTGTQAVRQIHNEYVNTTQIDILEESMGMMSMDSEGGYNVTNKSPFTAIREIGSRLVYGGSPASSTVHFRNRDSTVFGPAQALVRRLAPTVTVEQKETIGELGSNIFAEQGSKGADSILASKIYKKEDAGDAIAAVAAAGGTAAVSKYDQYARFAQIGSTGSATNRGITSSAIWNAARNTEATDPSSKTVAEFQYKAAWAQAKNYLIKISVDSGFKPRVTVGNGIEAKMMAPLVQYTTTISGLFLMADLMHDCYFDNREIMGTTTIRIVDPPKG